MVTERHIRPPPARPRARSNDLVAALLIAAVIATVAIGVTLFVLRLSLTTEGFIPIAIVGLLASLWLVTNIRWATPVLIAIAWAAIGQSFFGGVSPVQLGSVALLCLATWHAPRHPRIARDAMLVAFLIATPAVIAALVAQQPPPVDVIEDVALIPIVALNMRTLQDGRNLALTLAVLGAVLGIGAISSVLVGPSALFPTTTADGHEAARAAGPFGEPNFFALSLAALLPFAFWTTMQRGALPLLGVVSTVALIGGVLATGSRGALLASAFALLAFMAFVGTRTFRIAAAGLLLVAVAIAPLFAAQSSSSSQRSVSGRLTENAIAVRMFADHPITGVGPGDFPAHYREYSRATGNDPRVEREPHSLPLQIAAEQGVAGIVGWLGAAVLLVAAAGPLLWRRRIGRIVLLSLMTYMIGSIFLHGSQLRIVYMLTGAALGLAAACASACDDRSEARA